MKRIIYCFIAVMALAFTASCEKASQGLVLVADKTEFVADGEDEVSFTRELCLLVFLRAKTVSNSRLRLRANIFSLHLTRENIRNR